MQENIKIRKKAGLVACAFVMVNSGAKFAIESQMSKLYAPENIDFQFFENTDQAKKWINSYLAKMK